MQLRLVIWVSLLGVVALFLVWLLLSSRALTLTVLGTYDTGIFDDSAAEIVAYDPVSQRMYVVNASQAILPPEGLKFVPAAESPTGQALLLVANEASGTTTIYEIETVF